jgi:glutamyl-tRNA(Gln) amidotransferase subunit D
MLSDTAATIGDTISLKTTDNDQVVGLLMPRYESADDDHIVIKLKSGYNIGIETTKIQSITNLTPYTNQTIPNAKSEIPYHNKDGVAAVGGTANNKK